LNYNRFVSVTVLIFALLSAGCTADDDWRWFDHEEMDAQYLEPGRAGWRLLMPDNEDSDPSWDWVIEVTNPGPAPFDGIIGAEVEIRGSDGWVFGEGSTVQRFILAPNDTARLQGSERAIRRPGLDRAEARYSLRVHAQNEEPPRQLTSSTFHFPEELWDAGVEGETTLRIFVTEEGAVDSAKVDNSSGFEQFDSAAVRGAYDLHFEPAKRGGVPISVWVLLPVRFDFP